jgi:hypothetical protein
MNACLSCRDEYQLDAIDTLTQVSAKLIEALGYSAMSAEVEVIKKGGERRLKDLSARWNDRVCGHHKFASAEPVTKLGIATAIEALASSQSSPAAVGGIPTEKPAPKKRGRRARTAG